MTEKNNDRVSTRHGRPSAHGSGSETGHMADDGRFPPPDRRQFFLLLEAAVLGAKREKTRLAVLVMDVDRLRDINYSVGHRAADSVLTELALRVKSALRRSDTLVRIGGDEFAVLLPAVMGPDHAGLATHKLLKTVEAPFTAADRDFTVSLSIGVAIFPEHGVDAESLFSRAEMAMYQAKETLSGYAVYDEALGGIEPLLHIYEQELPRALGNNELDLLFQPKLDLRTGLICGAEALLRWPHPNYGLIGPDDFVPVAEKSDLIHALTSWVLNAALRHCAAWHSQGTPITVSVNLSTRNLEDRDLPDLVSRALETWGVQPHYLALEITETFVMSDQPQVFDILHRLNNIGLSLSIDDFGSRYSSLDYLRKLPVAELKIDKVFVSTMVQDKDNDLIVRTIIKLAHDFDLTVTAEGVEDQNTQALLLELGCDMAQGFFISKPLPGSIINARLRSPDWATASR